MGDRARGRCVYLSELVLDVAEADLQGVDRAQSALTPRLDDPVDQVFSNLDQSGLPDGSGRRSEQDARLLADARFELRRERQPGSSSVCLVHRFHDYGRPSQECEPQIDNVGQNESITSPGAVPHCEAVESVGYNFARPIEHRRRAMGRSDIRPSVRRYGRKALQYVAWKPEASASRLELVTLSIVALLAFCVGVFTLVFSQLNYLFAPTWVTFAVIAIAISIVAISFTIAAYFRRGERLAAARSILSDLEIYNSTGRVTVGRFHELIECAALNRGLLLGSGDRGLAEQIADSMERALSRGDKASPSLESRQGKPGATVKRHKVFRGSNVRTSITRSDG